MVDKRLNEFNNKAKSKLIELYSRYIENPSDKFIQDAALDIDNEYSNATDAIFHKEILKAIHKTSLIVFGKLSVNEAREILKKLEKIKNK